MITFFIQENTDDFVFENFLSEGEKFDNLGVSQLIASIDIGRWKLVHRFLESNYDFSNSDTRSPIGSALESTEEESLLVTKILLERTTSNLDTPFILDLPEFTEPLVHAMARRNQIDKLELIINSGHSVDCLNDEFLSYKDLLDS